MLKFSPLYDEFLKSDADFNEVYTLLSFLMLTFGIELPTKVE
jgi:hypothetical protein